MKDITIEHRWIVIRDGETGHLTIKYPGVSKSPDPSFAPVPDPGDQLIPVFRFSLDTLLCTLSFQYGISPLITERTLVALDTDTLAALWIHNQWYFEGQPWWKQVGAMINRVIESRLEYEFWSMSALVSGDE